MLSLLAPPCAAQWLFAGLYLVTVGLVLALYIRTKKTPLPALLLLVLSKRVHSIFVLRMFNDCVAMAFLYAATLCFTLHQVPAHNARTHIRRGTNLKAYSTITILS